ncbi:hypothetical protein RHGRI_015498 [Rhododendron griersonianum]|uniref:F-box associated beta-propeller type 1 domain-containing protein n=1 Tax=Rhododendron griersonianum TaxID=479676 RepID=A0AAV6KDZ5_9ERIC|nr:hypothetical protein RHGRI_015498 [Rhododendron griersonianum]
MSLLSNDGLNNGPINLDLPLLNYFPIVGICNGLVCVRLSPWGYRLILCNPSTRQFREIPGAEWNWEEENFQHVKHVSFGFGFHSSANDYKLIRIVLYSNPGRENNIRADLYVMSTDIWTGIDVNKLSLFFGEMNEYGGYDTIAQIEGSSTSALLNGVFYWPALVLPSIPTDPVVVMSFDMVTWDGWPEEDSHALNTMNSLASKVLKSCNMPRLGACPITSSYYYKLWGKRS